MAERQRGREPESASSSHRYFYRMRERQMWVGERGECEWVAYCAFPRCTWFVVAAKVALFAFVFLLFHYLSVSISFGFRTFPSPSIAIPCVSCICQIFAPCICFFFCGVGAVFIAAWFSFATRASPISYCCTVANKPRNRSEVKAFASVSNWIPLGTAASYEILDSISIWNLYLPHFGVILNLTLTKLIDFQRYVFKCLC